MADYDDVKVKGLIINNLTQEKYDELLAAGKIDPNQLYVTEHGDYATSEEFNSSVSALNSSLSSHTSNTSNPHSVTKAQVGLGNVDNTSDANKPISTATQNALDLKADKSDTYTKSEVDAKVSSVYRFMGSVATVDALPADATVGDTYNVEADGSNYAWDGTDWDKLSETVDLTPYLTKEDAAKTYETIESANLHKNNTSNPHNVTKAQVGLGNVDNTSDANKPISTATQTALDKKQDTLTAGTNITITGTTISAKDTTYTAGDGIKIENGIISNTRVSAEWGNVTGDITAQEDLQSALNLKADKSDTYTKSEVDGAIKTVDDKVQKNTGGIATLNTNKANASDLSSHTSNTSNPHGVTKAQVGLGNVDNTADLDKPISTATQAALDEKQNALTAGTGIKLETDTVSITDDVVTNKTQTTGGSFSVGNTTGKNTGSNSTHINSVRTINQVGAISIGHFAETTGMYGIGIGFSANAGYSSVGIGYSANAAAEYSVQLGDGTNTNKNTLQFRDYPLVDADGNIYSDRLIGNAVTKYLEMPSVSSKYNNIIVQYVGATTDEYTNGYFYKGSYIVANTYTVEENQIGFSISSIDANKLMGWFTEAVHPSTPLDFTKKLIIGVPAYGGDLVLYYNYNEDYGYGDYQESFYMSNPSEHGIEYTVDESLLYDVSEYMKLAEITISITDASWKQINVQPLQDLSGYAEKTTVQQIQQTLGTKADKSDTYTKAEVDAKVSSVYRFLGSVASVDDLPETATIGDTYNVENTGANYAWTGTAWDKLSETIDLTPYLTKEDAVKTYETIANVNLHKNNTSNPHKVTAAQVGLGNVNNTSDADKPISTATQAALDLKANQSTTYTKTETDNLLAKKLDTTTAASTYATKTELQNLDVLPTQTGNSGKYLTTNGTEASWASFPPVATLKQW